MISLSSTSWTTPFLLGVATALSVVWINQRISKSNPCERRRTRHEGDNKCNDSNQENTNTRLVMDAPDLEQRMLRKAETVIQWRTTRLLLVVERCTNDHNYSAILRTAEALGIQTVWMIDPPVVEDFDDPIPAVHGTTNISKGSVQDQKARELHHIFAQNALEWLTVRDFTTSQECVTELRRLGFTLWVTDLSQEATCLARTSPSVPDKVALVMGTEAVGCSQYMLDHADLRVYLPLRGFADSLNLSVATALILHQLFIMDPTLIGAITELEKRALRTEWFTKLCQQRLLTPSQKKTRNKLLSHLKQCQAIFEKRQANPTYVMQPAEQAKLDKWDDYNTQLQELEAMIAPTVAQAAVQEWIDHPPEPLGDLRRADSHRITFVGKNTKKKHGSHWKDMVATSNMQSILGVTANLFRGKLYQNYKADTHNERDLH